MTRQEFIDKLAAQLKEWDARLVELETKAELKKAEAREEIQERIRTLREKKQAAQGKLDQVRQASEAAWEELKAGAELAAESVKSALEKAAAQFEEPSDAS